MATIGGRALAADAHAAESRARMKGTRLAALITIVILAGGLAAVLEARGFALGLALRALVAGAAGSWYAVGSATLVRATPLILTGLAVAVAFRGGVFNIGADGQFITGATAATALALHAGMLRGAPAILVILAGGAAAGA